MAFENPNFHLQPVGVDSGAIGRGLGAGLQALGAGVGEWRRKKQEKEKEAEQEAAALEFLRPYAKRLAPDAAGEAEQTAALKSGIKAMGGPGKVLEYVASVEEMRRAQEREKRARELHDLQAAQIRDAQRRAGDQEALAKGERERAAREEAALMYAVGGGEPPAGSGPLVREERPAQRYADAGGGSAKNLAWLAEYQEKEEERKRGPWKPSGFEVQVGGRKVPMVATSDRSAVPAPGAGNREPSLAELDAELAEHQGRAAELEGMLARIDRMQDPVTYQEVVKQLVEARAAAGGAAGRLRHGGVREPMGGGARGGVRGRSAGGEGAGKGGDEGGKKWEVGTVVRQNGKLWRYNGKTWEPVKE